MTDGRTSRRVCPSLHKIGEQVEADLDLKKRQNVKAEMEVMVKMQKGLMGKISGKENKGTLKKTVVGENGKVKAVRLVWSRLEKKKL